MLQAIWQWAEINVSHFAIRRSKVKSRWNNMCWKQHFTGGAIRYSTLHHLVIGVSRCLLSVQKVDYVMCFYRQRNMPISLFHVVPIMQVNWIYCNKDNLPPCVDLRPLGIWFCCIWYFSAICISTHCSIVFITRTMAVLADMIYYVTKNVLNSREICSFWNHILYSCGC